MLRSFTDTECKNAFGQALGLVLKLLLYLFLPAGAHFFWVVFDVTKISGKKKGHLLLYNPFLCARSCSLIVSFRTELSIAEEHVDGVAASKYEGLLEKIWTSKAHHPVPGDTSVA